MWFNLLQFIAIAVHMLSMIGIDDYLMELQSFWISEVLTLEFFFDTLVIKKQLQGAECVHLKDGLGMLSFVSCNPSRFVDFSLVNHSDLLSPTPEFQYGPTERWGPSLLYSFVRILTNT